MCKITSRLEAVISSKKRLVKKERKKEVEAQIDPRDISQH